MRIHELFAGEKPVFSLEVFPPKKNGSIEGMYRTLAELADLRPDYISVTYGAGGTAAGLSCELSSHVKHRLGIEPLAHLTCINSSRSQVEQVLDRLRDEQIENVLALRGDRVPGLEPKSDFSHADELMRFVSGRYDLSLAGACYPEGHPDSESLQADVESLRRKQEAGAKHLVTQLFFDTDPYFRFLDRAAAAGVTLPVQPGVMPIVKLGQIQRTVALSSASLPASFSKMITRYEYDADGLYKAGIQYAVSQCLALLAGGAPGVHIYTMNNADVARQVYQGIRGALDREEGRT
ncbi:methylenetetrahydrofolate reductase [Anaerofilum sp. BX8]|uniref:Methylenetetrahydrofolate reductase n=1 Tax=Anaerofilum hominis TaxID=2763016 RepID=A0A923IF33_9FIRM|nr:methylenetetrahydrofolate reductase [Anaerofilum hominis]MBC5582225.1 methylenetetrahydrofolate reductase [Anaerofilum hominis]